MKQLIVLMAMMALGICMYMAIAGDGEGSIMNTLGRAWRSEVELRSYAP